MMQLSGGICRPTLFPAVCCHGRRSVNAAAATDHSAAAPTLRRQIVDEGARRGRGGASWRKERVRFHRLHRPVLDDPDDIAPFDLRAASPKRGEGDPEL